MAHSITADSVVILHINMKLTDGSVADSTRVNHKPAKITMGGGDLSPAFEAELLGLQVNDKKSFTLGPEDAFGYPNPANIHNLPRSRFDSSIKLENNSIIEFEQLNGQPLMGMVREFDDEHVTIDFNHPLCGQQVIFEIEVLEIQ